jgi:phosphate uptake regulator
MKRKVSRIGPSTLMVSLPSKWVKEYHISAGDELEINEEGPTIKVSKGTIKKGKTAEIRLSPENERYVRSYLGRLYRHGFTEIKISFSGSSLIKAIKKAVINMMGADITEIEENKCVIKIFPIEEEAIDFDKSIIKMIQTARYLMKIYQEDIQDGKFKRIEEIRELRDNNWKIKDYLIRNLYLNNKGLESIDPLNIILYNIEKIGTKILNFYDAYFKDKTYKKLNAKQLERPFKKIDYFLSQFVKFLSGNKLSFEEESSFRKEIIAEHSFLFDKLSKEKDMDPVIIILLFSIEESIHSSVSFMQQYLELNL